MAILWSGCCCGEVICAVVGVVVVAGATVTVCSCAS